MELVVPIRRHGSCRLCGKRVSAVATKSEIEAGNLAVKCRACDVYVLPVWDEIPEPPVRVTFGYAFVVDEKNLGPG